MTPKPLPTTPPRGPVPDGDPSPQGPRPVVMERVHATDGRLRLRLRKRIDADAMGALADGIAALAEVDKVVARPNTGSVIVSFRGPADPVVDAIGASAGARIVPPPTPPPVGPSLQFGLMKLDADIRKRTEDSVDLRAALALLLLFAAVVQLARGRIAGPATTLAMAAFSLIDAGRGK